MTPGIEADYIAKVSAVTGMDLHGIRWNLALADGLRFVTWWWNHHFERVSKGGIIYHGIECRGPSRGCLEEVV